MIRLFIGEAPTGLTITSFEQNEEQETGRPETSPSSRSTRSTQVPYLREQIVKKFDSVYFLRATDTRPCRFCCAKIPWSKYKMNRCVDHNEIKDWILSHCPSFEINKGFERSRHQKYWLVSQFPELYDKEIMQGFGVTRLGTAHYRTKRFSVSFELDYQLYISIQ